MNIFHNLVYYFSNLQNQCSVSHSQTFAVNYSGKYLHLQFANAVEGRFLFKSLNPKLK